MPKNKRLISFTDAHYKQLVEMMKEDGVDSVSSAVGSFINQEYKIRQAEKNKKPVGRPRKEEEEYEEEVEPDFTDDLPKNKPYYGKMVGPKELQYLMDRSNFSIN